MNYYKGLALFAGGVLTAAGLRMKDCVMETATHVQENAADILASAKDINQARMAQEEEIMEDTSETTTSSEA